MVFFKKYLLLVLLLLTTFTSAQKNTDSAYWSVEKSFIDLLKKNKIEQVKFKQDFIDLIKEHDETRYVNVILQKELETLYLRYRSLSDKLEYYLSDFQKKYPENGISDNAKLKLALLTLSGILLYMDLNYFLVEEIENYDYITDVFIEGTTHIPPNNFYNLEDSLKIIKKDPTLLQLLQFYKEKKHKKVIKSYLDQYDYTLNFCIREIENSPFYTKAINPFWGVIVPNSKKLTFSILSFPIKILRDLTYQTIKLYSKSIKHIILDTRKNFLDNNTTTEMLNIHNIQPGDILLEKNATKFADLTIPGYWMHAAVYIGSKADLEELDLIDHPYFLNIIDKIKGPSIIEGRITGVQVSSLNDLFPTDSIAILRPKKNWDKSNIRNTIITAAQQLGKNYDFIFNLRSNNSLTCAELIAKAYPIYFLNTVVLEVLSVSPDQIAVLVPKNPDSKEGELELIAFWDMGVLIYSKELISKHNNYSLFIDEIKDSHEVYWKLYRKAQNKKL